MRCWCVAARQEDGASWSAQGIQDSLAQRLPTFTHLSISKVPKADGLPAIAQVIGGVRFLKLAARRGITSRILFGASWLTPVVLAVVVALGIAVKLLDVLSKAKEAGAAPHSRLDPLDGNVLLMAALTVIAGLASKYLAPMLTESTKKKSREEFLSNVEKKQGTQEFKGFIEDLAGELAGLKFPRTLVIDHFDQLDEITQQVVDLYFRQHSERAIGSELWVVFESAQRKAFASFAALKPKAHGYSRTRIATQMPLTRVQKQHLVDQLGLDPQVIEFESVKPMFEDRTGIEGRFATRFLDYRAHHPADPKRYGSLDLAYLLALSSRPVSVSVSDRFLRNNLSTKEGLGAQLLKQFLRGSSLRRDEISDALVEVRGDFGSILAFGEGSEPLIRVIPEAADVLEKMAEELGLPPAGLGHLCWAVFWHSLLIRHPSEALWMQKLAHHILEADVSRAAPEIADIALAHTIDATLFAIRGCLDVCVFEKIGPLLDRGAVLLPSGSRAAPAEAVSALRELCGDAVVLLGTANAGRVLKELRSISPHALEAAATTLDVVGLETAMLPDIDDGATGDFTRAHLQHLRLRGIWLALSARSILPDSQTGLLARAGNQSRRELQELRSDSRRLQATPASRTLSATEALNLSMGLWCSALAMQAMPESLEVAFPYLSELVDFANDALAQVSAADSQSDAESSLLSRALARDVAASAAGAIVMAAHFMRNAMGRDLQWPDELRRKTMGSLQAAAAEFDDELPSDSGSKLLSNDVARRVDDWMHLSSLVWHAFNMDQLRHFTVIRRTQFNAACRARTDDHDKLLLQSEGAVLERQDFAGLLANTVAAAGLKNAAELSSYYLHRAASIALRNIRDLSLRHEFCHLVIAQGHTVHLELTELLEELLIEDSGPSGLETYLCQVPPEALSIAANRYVNAANNSGKEALARRVRSTIQSYLTRHPDEAGTPDTQALLDLDRLRRDMQGKKPVFVDKEMAAWNSRRESWLYPAFLEMIYRQRLETEDVRLESSRVLQQAPRVDGGNTRLLLALSIIERSDEKPTPYVEVSLRYVRNEMSRWEHLMSAERNVAIYRRLIWLDSQHKHEFAVPLAKWQLTQLRREHLQRFPQLVSRGQYFLLFFDYFEAMEVWGLHTDTSRQELRRRLELKDEERKEAAVEWKARSRMPVAFKLQTSKAVLSDFLAIGFYLFEPPLSDDADFANERENFNTAAQQALPGLLQRIVELDEVPKAIKDLLRTHSERLYRFSLPPDLQEPAARGAAAS